MAKTSKQPMDLQAASAQFAQVGRHQFQVLLDMPQQLLQSAEEIGEVWNAHAESEGKLVSELMKKLASAKTLPDAMSAYQQCMYGQLEILSRDSQRLFHGAEKLVTRNLNIFSNVSAGPSS